MSKGRWQGHQVYGSTTRLLLPPGSINLVAAIAGYQPTPIRGQGPKLSARLFPWPTVTLQLPSSLKLPDHAWLLVQIEVEGESESDESWHGPHSEDTLSNVLGAGSSSEYFEAGKVALQIGSHPHRVRLYMGSETGTTEVQGFTPTQLAPAQSDVTVNVPAANWQAAIDAISKPPK